MNLKHKTVAVLVEDVYEDMELWYPDDARRRGVGRPGGGPRRQLSYQPPAG
jgi:hypothetical protein